MSGRDDSKDPKSTLADDLDATKWDFQQGKDKKIWLRPVGSVFSDLPWEIQPQYLGPAPIQETETEDDAERDTATESPDDESLER
jgi:hypothetical protein